MIENQGQLEMSMPWKTAVSLYCEILQRGSGDKRAEVEKQLLRLVDLYYESKQQIAKLYNENAELIRNIMDHDREELDRLAAEAQAEAQRDLFPTVPLEELRALRKEAQQVQRDTETIAAYDAVENVLERLDRIINKAALAEPKF